MRYGSVCSGIEAASAAWHPLGWKPAWFSEIEPFPCSVLKHHYPDVPNLGDMTQWETWPDDPIDVLAGGTPCQSFSVAGKRAGMDDHRGQLALAFSAIARRYKPRWIVWENVPGVLSSGQGRDFGSFLGSLVELGYGCAYRVLDAQHFGVAQRRRRVFVVGHLGDWRRAAAVLFERKGLRRDSKAGGKAREGVAEDAGNGAEIKCFGCGVIWEPDGSAECCPICGEMQGYCPDRAATLQTTLHDYSRADVFNMVAQAFTAADARRTGTIHLHEQAPTLTSQTKRGDTEPCVLAFPWQSALDPSNKQEELSPTLVKNQTMAVAFKPGQSAAARTIGAQEEIACTLEAGGGGNNRQAVAIGTDCYNGTITGDVAATMGTPGSSVNASGPTVMQAMQVRRLTPIECERLQGFPDDYTNVPHRGKPAADGPRYKALGNSMAVPCMAWIGRRIQMVEDLSHA